jgi:hypothetical protein
VGSYTADQRRALHKQGKALPPGPGSSVPRFPIKNAADVGDAINLARTPEERRFIYKRARQLGCLGKIPATWKPDGSKTDN